MPGGFFVGQGRNTLQKGSCLSRREGVKIVNF